VTTITAAKTGLRKIIEPPKYGVRFDGRDGAEYSSVEPENERQPFFVRAPTEVGQFSPPEPAPEQYHNYWSVSAQVVTGGGSPFAVMPASTPGCLASPPTFSRYAEY
jgi:hypothetical protein